MAWENLHAEVEQEFSFYYESAELEAHLRLWCAVERNRDNARRRYRECAAVRHAAAQNHQRRKTDPEYREARNRAKRDYRARVKADPQRAEAARAARRRTRATGGVS